MSRGVITEKMKKTAVVLILLIFCAALPVRADQQFILTVGETMVLPCLLEIWSDQSVSCVISNPEVLMSDGSGRAVIALSEGTSDVYVHMTNPDTDIRYTFVVEPAWRFETPEEWALPEDAASGDESRADGGEWIGGDARDSGEAGINDDDSASTGPDAGDVGQAGGGTHGSGTPGAYDSDVTEISGGTHGSGTPENTGGAYGSDASESDGGLYDGKSKEEGHIPEDPPADSRAEAHIPDDDEHGITETIPFWEDRGSGGISFEVIEDNSIGRVTAGRDADGDQKVKYRPFAYLKSDGEVVPLFVCASGREVRWKYIGRTLYIETSKLYTGPYRVSARDCRGNIYYFSS